MPEERYYLSKKDHELFKRIAQDFLRRGKEGRNGPGRKARHKGVTGRMFKITSGTQNSSNFRWRYLGTEYRMTGEWTEEAINSDNVVVLFNTIEWDNTSSAAAVQSGIDLGITGITGVEKVPTNTIVCSSVMRMLEIDGTLRACWFFTYPNAPTINCAE
jgi:hypothetical protein